MMAEYITPRHYIFRHKCSRNKCDSHCTGYNMTSKVDSEWFNVNIHNLNWLSRLWRMEEIHDEIKATYEQKFIDDNTK